MKRLAAILASILISTSVSAQDFKKFNRQYEKGSGVVMASLFVGAGSIALLDSPKKREPFLIGAGVGAILGMAIMGNATKRLLISPAYVSYRF